MKPNFKITTLYTIASGQPTIIFYFLAAIDFKDNI